MPAPPEASPGAAICGRHEALGAPSSLEAVRDAPLACDVARQHGMELRCDGKGLALAGDGMILRGDFSGMLARIRPDRLSSELLVKAARLRGVAGPRTAVDATAGLGEDAFLLAASGFAVTLFERNPVVAALLADALIRALASPALSEAAGRMQLVAADSVRGLAELSAVPDLVLLDPMFSMRRKESASRKKAQLLQRLEGPCSEESELLDAALAVASRRVVVKRPTSGPYLAGRRPSHSLSGKIIRYDCYVPPRKASRP